MSEILRFAEKSSCVGYPDSPDLAIILANGHAVAVLSLEAAEDVADAIADQLSHRLLEARLTSHRAQLSMLQDLASG